MADRSSAELFSELFTLLAEMPDTPARATIALKFWNMTGDYDFSPYQMYCEPALMVLGLARVGIDADYPQDGMTTLFGPVET